ncbi:flagellar biosynthesis protein FlhF [Lysobacter niastensis]|uniref:Flagellar biosynthesis protein FlhF n=1 Tax=Lysobacter niastensis TaxID=380629 RepID=A0ABS0B9X0_9GAMM|nr:flagellar biosynthesis protein FlhF [Lysobacter niastensis]MBF6025622.1 flagellar biosynthesis protein FlhF [Lysobacter niastensis]
MRIKRFIAPDMRTALRMVRDEQGPDAVILSNRPIEGGIEIVAATDYDESLAQQALRAAVPALQPMQPSVPIEANTAELYAPSHGTPSFARTESPARPAPTLVAATAKVAQAAMSERAMPKVAETAIRGRAVFSIDDSPLPDKPAQAIAEPAHPVTANVVAETATHAMDIEAAPPSAARPEASRFEAMMAALMPRRAERASAMPEASAPALHAVPAASAPAASVDQVPSAPAAAVIADVVAAASAATASEPEDAIAADVQEAPEQPAAVQETTPLLRAVAEPRHDPAINAMRDELASMRQMIERELGQFAIERLRGSPARAAAYDALIGYGCDESLALTVAGAIDARLDPAQVHEPMLAELARQLSVARHEPIDDGGVIALVGPTGAGKTTTVAKLAARFAQRHRARDVALVTTDTERPGATEQLHIFGRRLGITVCEAGGASALGEALDQLADYPLVLIDTAGHGLRDRALLNQILWLRTSQRVRSLLVLPATTHPHDLGEVVRRYRPAAPGGVVLTKLDETGRLGSALSVLVQQGLSLAYTTSGQHVPSDIEAADADRLVATLEKVRRAAVNALGSPDPRPANLPTEDRHALAC